MRPEQWWKTGGLCGVLFVVCFVVGFIIQGSSAGPDDSAAEIKKYFIDNDTKYMIGDVVFAIGFVFFFLPFVGMLSSFLSRRETDGAGWGRVVLAYGAVMLAVGAAVSCLQGALAYGAANDAEDGLLKVLVAATYYANTLAFSLVVAGLVFTTSIIILRTGAFWNWLGYFGLVVTLLAVIGSLGVFSDDPMGPLGFVDLLALLGWGVFSLALSYGMWSSTEALEVDVEIAIVT